jgi:hypothetical protein
VGIKKALACAAPRQLSCAQRRVVAIDWEEKVPKTTPRLSWPEVVKPKYEKYHPVFKSINLLTAIYCKQFASKYRQCIAEFGANSQ